MREQIATDLPNDGGAREEQPGKHRRIALITGGSRGIGAETALALAEDGFNIALTYRNKAARAQRVLTSLTQRGAQGLTLPCDLTHAEEVEQLFQHLGQWTDHLDALVLNASGGLERDQLASDSCYPMRMNCEAQVRFVDAALPLLACGSVIVFVTSHWAHFYETIAQIPVYEPIARSKYAGEQALRARQEEFDARGIRLAVVTGDVVEGTVTPQLLERFAPDLIERRRARMGRLPTAAEMGQAIAQSVTDTALASGSTSIVGAV